MVKPLFPHYFNKAVENSEKTLSSLVGKISPIVGDAITKLPITHSAKYLYGWEIRETIADQNLTLAILVDSYFPQSIPDIYVLYPRDLCLHIPHIDSHNKLCIFSPQDKILPTADGSICQQSFLEAKKLLRSGIKGENSEDFADEFLSYWQSFECTTAQAISRLSLLNLNNTQSRLIIHITCQNIRLLCEDKEAGRKWLNNYCRSKHKARVQPGVFLWLQSPLKPKDYPKTNIDVWELMRRNTPETESILLKCAPKPPQKGFPVCYGFETRSGPCIAGSWLHIPGQSIPPDKFRQTWHYQHTRHSQRQFFTHRGPASPFDVERADHSWIYYRGGVGLGKELSQMNIALIGCGSLGSRVAEQLCSIGVGSLSIFDPEKLTTGNIGRHYLGMRDVGQLKAKATRDRLLNAFPQLTIESYTKTWESALSTPKSLTGKALLESDLIISTTGEMASNQFLNGWVLANSDQPIPPVIFSWAEPYCCAGHAIFVNFHNGCLQCGLDDESHLINRATKWHEPTNTLLRLEPACGVSFMPYGSLEMIPVATMTAKLASAVLLGKIEEPTHKVWLAEAESAQANHGDWTEWVKNQCSENIGEKVITLPWQKNAQCKSCSH